MNTIVALKINGREANASFVQEILTRYGCNIKTRVGFHEVNEDQCSMDGVIVLQLFGKDSEIQAMHEEFNKLNGVTFKIIEF